MRFYLAMHIGANKTDSWDCLICKLTPATIQIHYLYFYYYVRRVWRKERGNQNP